MKKDYLLLYFEEISSADESLYFTNFDKLGLFVPLTVRIEKQENS